MQISGTDLFEMNEYTTKGQVHTAVGSGLGEVCTGWENGEGSQGGIPTG